MNLHDLPPDHRLRNVPIGSIDGIKIVCRHTKSPRNPRTWKIKDDTFNRLGETWKLNFDFVVPEARP